MELTEEEKELDKQVFDIMQGFMIEAFLKLPVQMRLRYFVNILGDKENKDINFDKINEMICKDIDKYDYNNYSDFETKEDIFHALYDCETASLGVTAWSYDVCKDCGQEFYLMINEVDFYQQKGFELPRRCPKCRAKRREKNESNSNNKN
jgi:hypothetical protein